MSDSSHRPLPRVAVVTGASSGIGRAVAGKLAEQFDHIVLHAATNLSGLQSLAKELASKGVQSRCILQDLSNESLLGTLVECAFSWYGHIDCWVHAAGADVLTTHWKDRTFAEKFDRLWEVDVRGSLCTARTVAQRMFNQNRDHGLSSSCLPSIVLIGWDQAEHGMEGDSGIFFAATKGAIMAATRSLAMNFGPHVRVNCVAPGWIQTAGVKEPPPHGKNARWAKVP